MAETLLAELKRYVGFQAEDEAALRKLGPVASPQFVRIADLFYRRILDHEEARKALAGESQVGRLKVTLVEWMEKLLTGPWDEQYYELRARIGRVHVRISLPQHYMFGAMNVIRASLNEVIDSHYLDRPDELRQARTALGKILDLELAIMLHTYREDLLSQQARVERLSTFGQLVGSIGHELRNPLGVIESSLFILKGRVGSDPRAEKQIQRISEQLTVANDIVTKLLDMIRDRPLTRTNVKLAEVLSAAASAVDWPPQIKLIQSGLEGIPEIQGDAVQLRQVFVNLLENAVQATGAQGEVRVQGALDGTSVEVTVEDTGPGVDVSIRNRLFEPLVTTKTRGIGLGLALVKRIVERHGGFIAYRPGGDGGALFAIRLPIANP